MNIKKKETIIVNTVQTNTYGDLEFTDTQGKSYKIGKARVDKFPAIQVGAEVELIWVDNPHRKDAEYIYSATQTGKHVVLNPLVEAAKKLGGVLVEPKDDKYPHEAISGKNIVIPKPVQPTQEAPQSKSSPVNPQSNTMTPSGQEIGMTTKEIGDMIRANKLSVIFGEETSKKLVEWYKNRIKSTTGS